MAAKETKIFSKKTFQEFMNAKRKQKKVRTKFVCF